MLVGMKWPYEVAHRVERGGGVVRQGSTKARPSLAAGRCIMHDTIIVTIQRTEPDLDI
jgi:hypothetical protein